MVGEAMNCAGMSSRSIDWNSAASRPLKSRRRSRIFWYPVAETPRAESMKPASPGPYSARRAGNVASCATAVSTAQLGAQSRSTASTAGILTRRTSAPSEVRTRSASPTVRATSAIHAVAAVAFVHAHAQAAQVATSPAR